MALGATFLIRAEARRNVKGKAPAVAARRRILVAGRERGRSREIKHIGDRFRKPQWKPVHASNDAGTGTSEAATCSCSTRAVRGDDVVQFASCIHASLASQHPISLDTLARDETNPNRQLYYLSITYIYIPAFTHVTHLSLIRVVTSTTVHHILCLVSCCGCLFVYAILCCSNCF